MARPAHAARARATQKPGRRSSRRPAASRRASTGKWRLAARKRLTRASKQRRRGPRVRDNLSDVARAAGDKIFVATGSAMPADLLTAIRRSVTERGSPADVYYMATFASQVNFSDEVTDLFRPHLFFVSMSNRAAASGGRATRHRDSLNRLGNRIARGEFDFDTVVVQVSPPNAAGEVSLGTTGDLTMDAIEVVKRNGGKILAVVNPRVPFTSGKNRIRYTDLDEVIEREMPLPELTVLEPTAVESRLAQHVADVTPLRATIQVGIGGALVGIGKALRTRKPARIWSEMGSDWVLDLMTGPGATVERATFSFLHGSNRLYQFAHRNGRITMDSSRVVNDPDRISSKARMVAINTALQIDLSGNANAETIAERVISAPGGQPDFMRGASRSRTGRAVLAIRSTNKTGGSNVVIDLDGPITTPGGHVDHVVTEWGATPVLRGLSTRKRALATIEVAHPAHRAGLADRARELGLLTADDVSLVHRSILPAIETAPVAMRAQAVGLAEATGAITPAQAESVRAALPEAGRLPVGPPPPPPPPGLPGGGGR